VLFMTEDGRGGSLDVGIEPELLGFTTTTRRNGVASPARDQLPCHPDDEPAVEIRPEAVDQRR